MELSFKSIEEILMKMVTAEEEYLNPGNLEDDAYLASRIATFDAYVDVLNKLGFSDRDINYLLFKGGRESVILGG